MADYIRVQTEGVPNTMKTRYEDMGDTSHALVVSVDGSDVGLVDGTAVQIVDASGDLVGVDDIVGALHVIDVLHYETHEGNAYFASFKTVDATPLADNGTLVFALTTTTKTLHVISDASAGGNAEYDIFEDSTITGGAATTVFNRNRPSVRATTVTVVRDPTVNAAGTLIDQQFIPGGRGGNASGGSGSVRHEWIFATSLIYLFRITNRAGNAQPASLSIGWYEE